MSFRSDELYRSVAMPAAPRQGDLRGVNTVGVPVAGDSKVLGVNQTAAKASESCRGPVLPVDLAKFPKQPLYAILKGTYPSCFESVARALGELKVVVEKLSMDKGKIQCALDGRVKDSKFIVRVWRVADEECVLIEVLPLSADSRTNLTPLFDRLCRDSDLKTKVVSCAAVAETSHIITPGSVFATPVF